ncbi:MAG: AAA family ATPase [Clostridiaceae bacterium]|jgi:RecD/TraA family predicted helicase|nr:AAA family ATPase [Clostridiaceae bacterium]
MSNIENDAENKKRPHLLAQLDIGDVLAVGESGHVYDDSRPPYEYDSFTETGENMYGEGLLMSASEASDAGLKIGENVYAYDDDESDLYTGDVRFSGIASRIVFRNEQNSYTVLELDSEDDKYTLIGVMPVISAGDMVEGEGVWKFHSLYGPQIEVRTIFRREPEEPEKIERYLAAGAVKGIGPATARKLVEAFGAETLNVMREQPERVARLRGIGRKKALEFSRELQKDRAYQALLFMLLPLGIGASRVLRIYKMYGLHAETVIREDPFALAETIPGIGFQTADRIAEAVGVSGDHPTRLRSAVCFALQRHLYRDGNTIVPSEKIVSELKDKLNVAAESIEAAIDDLLITGKVVRPFEPLIPMPEALQTSHQPSCPLSHQPSSSPSHQTSRQPLPSSSHQTSHQPSCPSSHQMSCQSSSDRAILISESRQAYKDSLEPRLPSQGQSVIDSQTNRLSCHDQEDNTSQTIRLQRQDQQDNASKANRLQRQDQPDNTSQDCSHPSEVQEMDEATRKQTASDLLVPASPEGVDWITLQDTALIEQRFACRVSFLASHDLSGDLQITEEEALRAIRATAEAEGFEPDQEQVNALMMALTHSFSVLTGGPGTGKTTIVRLLTRLLRERGENVQLAAPTGRAARRLAEVCQLNAKTIHRLLSLQVIEEGHVDAGFWLDAEALEADTLIVDECSMIDIFLFTRLLHSVIPGSRVLLIGDADQLPSIGPGQVLRDLLSAPSIPHARLDRIYRQEEHRLIVSNAHRILKGEPLEIDQTLESDFLFIPCTNEEEMQKGVLKLCSEVLPRHYKVDGIYGAQVLTAIRRGKAGVSELNTVLQKFAHKGMVRGLETHGDTFMTGDKVIQTKNRYQLEWTIRGTGTTGKGIMNGEMGVVQAVSLSRRSVTVLFEEERVAVVEGEDLDSLDLAYATTVHKAQGSEYPVEILVIPAGSPSFLTRNLLYTGVTRAKQHLFLLTRKSTLSMMLRNNEANERACAFPYWLNMFT